MNYRDYGLTFELCNSEQKLLAAEFIEMNQNTKPIALPLQSPPHWLDIDAGTEVRVCGWGKINNRPAIYPDSLHCVNVPLVDSQICNSSQVIFRCLERSSVFQHYNGAIFDGMFCAGQLGVGEKDACQGDSGGPVRTNSGTLIGLVSWGYSCASPNFPGVYTDVAVYSDWITSTIDDYNKI